MRNLNLLLIITAFGLLFSSFCYDNKERKQINHNLSSTENTLFLENNYSALFDDSTFIMKSLINASVLKSYQNNISDSVKSNSEVVKENQYVLSTQFTKLQKALKKYQTIEKNNQWKKIDIDSADYKNLKPSDSGAIVKQIRERLFIVGD